MTEDKYKQIINNFLSKKSNIDDFIEEFMHQWKTDRDNDEKNDDKFQRLIDRLFTTCDCYSDSPEGPFEINEQQLRDEVALLNHIWFG